MILNTLRRICLIIIPTLLVLFIIFFNTFEVKANDNVQELFQNALQKSKDGDFSSALNDWNIYLEKFPQDFAAFSNRGNCFLALGDIENAIQDQTKSIELLPENPDAYFNRGIAEEAINRLDEAEDDYNWIIKNFPQQTSVLYNLGNIRGAQGDWIAAKNLFSKASLNKSKFPIAQSSKALVEYHLGETKQAESELRDIIRRYPMFADARAALSALLWKKGFLGEATSHWIAAKGLDIRYRDRDWLLNIRRWPPGPINDLMTFLDLEHL